MTTSLKDSDIFVIDEFYKLSFDKEFDERAVSLNVALSKLLSVSKQYYMIGPNIDVVKGVERLTKGYHFIPTDFNTVALNIFEYGLGANDLDSKNEKLREILVGPSFSGQTIVYCKSPASAAKVAYELSKIIAYDDVSSEYTDWIDLNYSSSWSYAKSIKKGVGIHYGSLPRAIQQKTVDLFNSKEIRILVCTSTIIEGVNTNAENVIIYDNRSGNSSIDRFTHNNIKGRAGRMKVHFVGNVHCLEAIPLNNFESRVVEIPLGSQSEKTPYNMLAGIQPDHIDEGVKSNYYSFLERSDIPKEILKGHASYDVTVLAEACSYADRISEDEIRILCKKGMPKSDCLHIICNFVFVVAVKTLRRSNLACDDLAGLNARVASYLYASSYQDYMNETIERLISADDKISTLSDRIDRELSIIRNIFAYVIPKATSLLQDLITRQCTLREIEVSPDFSIIMAVFENYHLPSSFAALEEMGVPNQTLSKLVKDKLKGASVNSLIRYLRWYSKRISILTPLDREFINRAIF